MKHLFSGSKQSVSIRKFLILNSDFTKCKSNNSFKLYSTTSCISHLPDTNFWHYSLQLNTYKAILESKYNKKITALYLVRLHPDNPKKTYELIKCADLSNEIADLFELRRNELLEKSKQQ